VRAAGTSISEFRAIGTNARESRPLCSRAKIYDRRTPPFVEVMAVQTCYQDTQPLAQR
jgi:hypothetical protein